MPCYDSETHEGPIRLQNKVHALTDLLCQACNHLENIDPIFIKDNIDLKNWYIKHLQQDKVRKEMEAKGRANLTTNDYRKLYDLNIPEDIKTNL